MYGITSMSVCKSRTLYMSSLSWNEKCTFKIYNYVYIPTSYWVSRNRKHA